MVSNWERPGILVERQDDGGLRVWVGGKQFFLTPDDADDFERWLRKAKP